jgi:hypothetical protein
MGERGMDLSPLGYGPEAGCYEEGNELSALMKCVEFLE